MDFVGAIQAGFKNYANFRGVAGRAEYWYFVLFLFLSGLVLSTIDTFLGIGVLATGFQLATVVPATSVLVRRLRDAGFSWIWLLVFLASLGVMFVGIFGIVNIGIQSGVFTSEIFMNPDVEISDAALESLASDPSFLGLALLSLIGSLLTLVSGLLVNIILPVMPTKTFEQGNKRVKPETL